MSDLTEKELNLVFTAIDGDHDGIVDFMTRLAIEVKRHRAAKAADKERVRSVVDAAAIRVLSALENYETHDEAAHAIAERAAEQLSGAAPVLSEKDRDIAIRMRKSIQHTGEFTALLDRSIGDV